MAPRLHDIIIPFTLASIQVILQGLTFSKFPSLGEGPFFMLIFTGVCLVGLLSYWNLYSSINKYRWVNIFTYKNADIERKLIMPYVIVCIFSIYIDKFTPTYPKDFTSFNIKIPNPDYSGFGTITT